MIFQSDSGLEAESSKSFIEWIFYWIDFVEPFFFMLLLLSSTGEKKKMEAQCCVRKEKGTEHSYCFFFDFPLIHLGYLCFKYADK